MARASNRDVTLTLSIDTLGTDGIAKLEDSVRSLAKQGGDAAPQFNALADQIGRLGAQNDALQAVRNLGEQVDALARQQEQAAESAKRASDRLTELKTAATDAAARQAQAAQDVLAGQKAYNDATLAIRTLRTEYDAAGRKTEEYRAKLRELQVAQTEAQNRLVDLRAAQRDANTAATEAVQAQTKAETAYVRSAKAADDAGKALEKSNTALRDAVGAAESLGVSTENVAQAQAELLQAFNQVGRSAAELQVEQRLLADIEAEAAAAARQTAQAIEAESVASRQAAQASAALERQLLDELQAQEALAAAKREQAANAAAAATAWQREADAIVSAAEAQRRQLAETERMITAQRELAGIRAFEQQAEEAKKLAAAADYVRFWTEELQRAEAATAQVNRGLQSISVRPLEDIQGEISDVRAALENLAARAQASGQSFSGAFSAGQARIAELEREIRQMNGTLTTSDRLAGLFKNSMGQITAGNLIADAVGYLVEKVKELGREFVTTIAQTEQMRRGLMAVYKDTGTVAQQIDFLRATALNAGVSVGSLQQNFVKFSASMTGANVPLAESNALFESVTRAAGTLGLSGESVTGMLEALSQMAGKGTVSLEELRQQLGDRLPGAMSLVAKGLGITEAELIKLVESGNLAARDLFPALTQALRTMSGEVSGLTPSWENLKTALTTVAQAGGDAGWTQVLIGGLKLLTAAVGILGGALLGITNTLNLVGSAAVAIFAPMGSLADRLGFLREQFDAAAERQARFSNAIDAAIGSSERGAAAAQAQAEAAKMQAAAQEQAATAMSRSAAVAEQYTAAAAKTAEGQAAAGQAAKTAADGYVALSARLSEVVAGLNAKQEAYDKEAKAVDVNGKAIEALTKLRGNEQETLLASAQAGEANVAALTKAATAYQAEVEVLTVLRDAKIQQLQAQGLNAEAIAKETEAINQKLLKASAEADQSRAAVLAAQNEAAARQLAAQAYADNSARVDEFAAAAARADAALRAMEQAEAAGMATSAEVAEARRNAAVAMGLYKDALGDVVTNLQAEGKEIQASVALYKAEEGVRQQSLELRIEEAQRIGDYTTAMRLFIEQKQSEINVVKASSDAKRLEAETELRVIEAQLRELEQIGQLTPAKEKEIEARRRNAEAKLAEANNGEAARKQKEEEMKLLQKQLAILENKGKLDQANYNADIARLKVGEAFLQQRAQQLRAAGKEEEAIKVEIDLKRQQIAIVEATARAKMAEADAQIALAQRELEGLQRTGQLTEEKKLEIEARIRNAEAKKIEAEMSGAVVAGLNAEIAALREASRAAKDKASAEQSAAKAAVVRTAGTDVGTLTGVYNFLRAAGVDDEETARNIALKFSDGKGNIPYENNRGMREYAQGFDSMSMALLRAAEQYTFGGGKASAEQAKAVQAAREAAAQRSQTESALQPTSAELANKLAEAEAALQRARTVAQPAPAADTTSNKTVTINIGGRSQSINVASAADQASLVSILRQLESAAATGTPPGP